jgi:pyridoxine 5-phosphate synthase
MIRLGVNIDHVATVRQARGESYPDPVQAAVMAEIGGADNITCHLREDRRHIQDRDVYALKDTIKIPLNFEMACTPEMIAMAKKIRPAAVTLVPEKRQERTTEGGLDLKRNLSELTKVTKTLQDLGILVSLFIEPTVAAVEMSHKISAKAVEFHTGGFCRRIDAAMTTADKHQEVAMLAKASIAAHDCGIQSHFGHGLHYANAHWLQIVPFAEEANIGHAIISRAIFCGLETAVRQMRRMLNHSEHYPGLAHAAAIPTQTMPKPKVGKKGSVT